MTPMIFLAVCKGGIFTTSVKGGGAFFTLATNVSGIFPTYPRGLVLIRGSLRLKGMRKADVDIIIFGGGYLKPESYFKGFSM